MVGKAMERKKERKSIRQTMIHSEDLRVIGRLQKPADYYDLLFNLSTLHSNYSIFLFCFDKTKDSSFLIFLCFKDKDRHILSFHLDLRR